MKTWKIYKHTLILDCPSKGKSYIGQTSEENPNRRWANGSGYFALRKNKQHTLFWFAVQKYGWDNFKHEVIESDIKTLDKANDREKYWIAYYHTFVEDPECWGYNMTAGGSGVAHKCSEATKQKISNTMKGRKFTTEHKAKLIANIKRKPIICIETGIRYESTAEAARQTGISRENIKTAVNGKRLSAGGYHWAKVNDQEKIIALKSLNGKCKAAKRKVICTDTNEVFNSITEAAKAFGVNQSAISNALKRKTKVKGKVFKYFD